MPVLLLFCAVLFWSAHNVVAKSVIDYIPPFSFTFYRWLLAFLILAAFTWPQVRADWPEAKRRWGRLLLTAATGITAFNTLLYVAVQTTTAVNIGVISSIFPGMIALFSLLILGVALNRVQVAGMLISFLGVLLVILRGDYATVSELVFVEGDLWMLGGIVFGSLYPVLLHKQPQIQMHPLSLLTLLIGLGTVVALPLFLIDLAMGRYVAVNREAVAGLVFVSLFPSVLSYLFWNRGINLIGANRAGLFLNLVPILTAVMAYLFLGEILAWYHFAGLALVVGGMLLFNLDSLPWRRSDA